MRVVFSKSTWLKGTIEKHTLAAVKDSQADFIVKAGQATGVHMSPFQVLGHHSLNPETLAPEHMIPMQPLWAVGQGGSMCLCYAAPSGSVLRAQAIGLLLSMH